MLTLGGAIGFENIFCDMSDVDTDIATSKDTREQTQSPVKNMARCKTFISRCQRYYIYI
jgi:hypothetical protein